MTDLKTATQTAPTATVTLKPTAAQAAAPGQAIPLRGLRPQLPSRLHNLVENTFDSSAAARPLAANSRSQAFGQALTRSSSRGAYLGAYTVGGLLDYFAGKGAVATAPQTAKATPAVEADAATDADVAKAEKVAKNYTSTPAAGFPHTAQQLQGVVEPVLRTAQDKLGTAVGAVGGVLGLAVGFVPGLLVNLVPTIRSAKVEHDTQPAADSAATPARSTTAAPGVQTEISEAVDTQPQVQSAKVEVTTAKSPWTTASTTTVWANWLEKQAKGLSNGILHLTVDAALGSLRLATGLAKAAAGIVGGAGGAVLGLLIGTGRALAYRNAALVEKEIEKDEAQLSKIDADAAKAKEKASNRIEKKKAELAQRQAEETQKVEADKEAAEASAAEEAAAVQPAETTTVAQLPDNISLEVQAQQVPTAEVGDAVAAGDTVVAPVADGSAEVTEVAPDAETEASDKAA